MNAKDNFVRKNHIIFCTTSLILLHNYLFLYTMYNRLHEAQHENFTCYYYVSVSTVQRDQFQLDATLQTSLEWDVALQRPCLASYWFADMYHMF